ncbi:hypothetical protein G4B88_019158 [Cannabis sativa]|uniref:DUF1985 domain-containing protein n=1 Tax=Cannabis sativa TaxID=3483 RepID=A0A7J6HNS2_CANSA|nr:hypothetical protein G4B88_019158 [Cannabis sativa]
MSLSPEVSGSKKKLEKTEEVASKIMRSGVSEASFDDRCSKKLKSVVEDDDDFDSECDETPIVLPKKLKVWDFYLKPKDRFCGNIIYWFDVGVIAEINDRLTTKQLTMFQESCFGLFLDLEECNMQSQVIHTALSREVHQANVKEIWFDFGNSRTRSGLGEFAIISGLLCKGDSSMEKYIGRGDTFVVKHFSDMTVNFATVKQRFLNSIFKDDVFAFRMVVLYFVTNFLLSKPSRKKVDGVLLHLIGPVEENQKLDIAGFEFSYGSESDDDFEDDELKDSVLGLVVRQVGFECVLKEFRKEVDEKFALLEENLKGYIDRKVGEDLTFYLDTKFSELKDLIKDSIANVVSQGHDDEDDGGGGGVASPRNLDDISDDVDPTVKGDGEDASNVKDGEDCVDSDGDVYKVIKNISEMSVKEVDSQDFDGLFSLEKDMLNFDIMNSLLGQTETVAMVEDEILGSDGGNVGGVEGIAEKDKIKVCKSPRSKRAHKPSVALQSPYRNDFGSSGSNEKKKKKNVKGLYPFTSGLFDHLHELQQKAFDEWFRDGFKDENKFDRHFCKVSMAKLWRFE